MRRFCRALVPHEAFVADLEAFVAGSRRRRGPPSATLLLKLTAPGVPDLYQGDELLSLSLVDPDNRRPVDWASGARCSRRSATARLPRPRRASCS